MAGLSIDVGYEGSQDRLVLTTRTAESSWRWWLTRKMAMRWMTGWVAKLQEVPLPVVAVSNVPNLVPSVRNLADEHALSLEFDSPQVNAGVSVETQVTVLLEQVSLHVRQFDCQIQLIAQGQSLSLTFSRKDAHCFLEALALKARQAGWFEVPVLPEWLGVSLSA